MQLSSANTHLHNKLSCESSQSSASNESSTSCRACRAVLFGNVDTCSKNTWARHVERVVSSRAKWNLGLFSQPKAPSKYSDIRMRWVNWGSVLWMTGTLVCWLHHE